VEKQKFPHLMKKIKFEAAVAYL